MRLPGLIGRAFKFIWHDGEIPGRRWLSQVSRWIAGIESPDQSVLVYYHDNGINLQVNSSMGVVLGKVVSVPDANTVLCDIYADGILESPTTTGVEVAVSTAWDVMPEAGDDVWLTLRPVVNPSTTDAAPYEAVNLALSSTSQAYTQSVYFSTAGTFPTLGVGTNNLILDYDSGGQYMLVPTTDTTYSGLMSIDTSSVVYPGIGLQISGGYLQARTGGVRLALTTDSPPKLQIVATTGYGSWVNGPQVGECT